MTPNLHELANTGGYGAAQAALKKAGCWDEGRAPATPGMKRWTIALSGTRAVEVSATVTVEAESREDAVVEAWQAVADRHWVHEADCDEVEPEGEDILKVEEMELTQ